MKLENAQMQPDLIIFNAGSTSLKISRLRFTTSGSKLLQQQQEDWDHLDAVNSKQLILTMLNSLTASYTQSWISAHRVVHGGRHFAMATWVGAAEFEKIAALRPLAPLHQGPALSVIKLIREQHPNKPLAAVFDTGLFQDLPDLARHYPLPIKLTREQALYRYGFHGLAHASLRDQYRAEAGTGRRLITLQLGGGCSATAFLDNVPRDTSMGFTPAEGLMMSSRCGSIDSGLILHLLGNGKSIDSMESLLNRESGLIGVSGRSGDMRELLSAADDDPQAEQAIALFCYRIQQQIGAYMAVLGGLDALVFGGGIGAASALIRERVCAGLAGLGIALDPSANHSGQACLSAPDSTVDIRRFTTDESSIIAQHVQQLLNAEHASALRFPQAPA